MRILLVEDDDALGQAVLRALQHEGYATDLVRNANAGLHALQLEHFDLLLLDLGLPDMDGTEVIRVVRQRKLTLPIMILTARDAVESRVQALDLGADDYMIKPVEIAELCARIRALVRRRSGNATPRLQLGQLELDLASKQAFAHGRPLDCSAREWSVLEYLALHTGQIISKEQLIQAIANWDQTLSANAIEAYVHRVRTKLGDCGVVIRTVRGFGYMLNETVE